MEWKDYIRDISDFPRKGIIFRDLTPLCLSHEASSELLACLLAPWKGLRIDKVAAIEARGFLFGPMMAMCLGVGFIPIRKVGKLPAATYRAGYELEYGNAEIEIHRDAVRPGDTILIHDDLLATGGSVSAAIRLIQKAGGKVVGTSFIMELCGLEGRKTLGNLPVESLIRY